MPLKFAELSWNRWVTGAFRASFVMATAIVVYLSLTPRADLPDFGVNDKLQHLTAYAGLAILGCCSFPGWPKSLYILILLSVVGAVVELLQFYSPGRSPEAADALADFLGAVAGVAVWSMASRLRSQRFRAASEGTHQRK